MTKVLSKESFYQGWRDKAFECLKFLNIQRQYIYRVLTLVKAVCYD